MTKYTAYITTITNTSLYITDINVFYSKYIDSITQLIIQIRQPDIANYSNSNSFCKLNQHDKIYDSISFFCSCRETIRLVLIYSVNKIGTKYMTPDDSSHYFKVWNSSTFLVLREEDGYGRAQAEWDVPMHKSPRFQDGLETKFD